MSFKSTSSVKNAGKLDSQKLPFKQRKAAAERKHEVDGIRTKFPHNIPVVLERYAKEKALPFMEKEKFLVPEEITMSQFIHVVRNRMKLHPNQAFYLLIANRSLASMSLTLAEIYRDYKDKEDGFLYMTYASHEMFGGDC